jgi:prolyl-tRNA synthetase
VAALVRGDHELNESKLGRALGAGSVELADEETIERVTGAPVGFAGPVGLEGVEIVADRAVMGIRDGVTGANRADAHLMGVTPGEDFTPHHLADIRTARNGDPCLECGRAMKLSHGIEVGHVFQLGTKYSKALEARFLDDSGRSRPYLMGSYGIGVNRIAAALVERFADEDGIVWHPAIAPYQAVVMPLNMSDEQVAGAAEDAYEALRQAGVDVLLDDREERPGVKFNDADLIGFPLRVVVGRGYLTSGKLEVQVRRDDSRRDVAPQELAGQAAAMLDELSAEVVHGAGEGAAE